MPGAPPEGGSAPLPRRWRLSPAWRAELWPFRPARWLRTPARPRLSGSRTLSSGPVPRSHRPSAARCLASSASLRWPGSRAPGAPSPLGPHRIQRHGQSPLPVLSSLAGPSPLSGQPVRPAPQVTPTPQGTPTQQATPAPQPSSTATSTASGGNGQQQSGPQQPAPRRFTFYDSVTPQAIPQGQIVATYDTGAHPIPVFCGRCRLYAR